MNISVVDTDTIQPCFLPVKVVLVVVMLTGNGMTILAQSLSRKPLKGISSRLILNLAVADLLNGFALLYNVIIEINENYPMNKYACLLRYLFMFCGMSAGFYAIAAIAINRYIAIIYPLKYTEYTSERVVFVMIAVNWCAALLISTVPLYWNNFKHVTDLCKNRNIIPSCYVKVIWIPNFTIVWIIVLVLYCGIWKAARAHTQRSSARSGENGRSIKKSNLVVFLFLGCFTICYLPKVVTTLLRVFGLYERSTAMKYLNHIQLVLAISNSAVNPVIYAWKSPVYREAYRRLFRLEAPNHDRVEQQSDSKKTTSTKNST